VAVAVALGVRAALAVTPLEKSEYTLFGFTERAWQPMDGSGVLSFVTSSTTTSSTTTSTDTSTTTDTSTDTSTTTTSSSSSTTIPKTEVYRLLAQIEPAEVRDTKWPDVEPVCDMWGLTNGWLSGTAGSNGVAVGYYKTPKLME
jgi:hypothetical protein